MRIYLLLGSVIITENQCFLVIFIRLLLIKAEPNGPIELHASIFFLKKGKKKKPAFHNDQWAFTDQMNNQLDIILL